MTMMTHVSMVEFFCLIMKKKCSLFRDSYIGMIEESKMVLFCDEKMGKSVMRVSAKGVWEKRRVFME